jgi:predicted membrane protein
MRTKAEAISNGVLLIFLGLLFYTNWWWPGILVAIWATFATRQYLTERYQDLLLTTILLFSLFVVALFNLSWNLLTPILFVLAGGYLILRAYFSEQDPLN